MAASVVTKTNHLLSSIHYILTWPKFGFRTICSGRLGFSTSTSPSSAAADTGFPVAGFKVLVTFKEEFEIGSRLITLETGKIARFANGSVVLGMEETKVLSTVCSAKGDGVRDFLPLTVSKVSDVVSVGQKLSFMCIGQDLRGNIKLSLKAALPHGTSELAEAPASDGHNQVKKKTNIADGVPADKGKNSGATTSHFSTSAVVIRSVMECDEVEKSSSSSASTKTSPKTPIASKSDHRLKRGPSQTNVVEGEPAENLEIISSTSSPSSQPDVVIRSDVDFNEEKSDLSSASTETSPKTTNALKSDHKLKGVSSQAISDPGSKKVKNSKLSPVKETKKEPIVLKESKDENRCNSAFTTIDDSTEKDSTSVISMDVTATVLQVRKRGLVLDLGGGIRRLYRIEGGGEREYAIGDVVRVKCSRFTTKGIPVVSMLQD